MSEGRIGERPAGAGLPSRPDPAGTGRVRLLTYNIRHCRGTDGRVCPERVAGVIAATGAEVVALQEVDVGRARSGGLDQAEDIARRVGMDAHFHPALHIREERYGDAVLSRPPSRLVRAGPLPSPLPSLVRRPGLEPRGALWVEVAIGAVRLQVLNTHLGLFGAERVAQVRALLGPDWLGDPACRAPAVLLGDLNATGWSRAYRRLSARLTDARRLGPSEGGATFPSRFPLLRLDHVLVSEGIAIERIAVVDGPAARAASDHLPVLAEIRVGPARAGGTIETMTGKDRP